MWGWRILSSAAPFTEGRDKSITDNKKIIVLMTDGVNTYYPKSKFTDSWYAAWGYGDKEHLGTGSGSWDSDDWEEKMNARTEVACANAKTDGVIIYTVAFEVADGSSSKALLEDCASRPELLLRRRQRGRAHLRLRRHRQLDHPASHRPVAALRFKARRR